MTTGWAEPFDHAFGTRFTDKNVSYITLRQRAVRAQPRLVTLAEEAAPGDEDMPARTRPTVTYGELAEAVGTSPQYLGNVLAAIDFVGQELGDPPLSPLVETAQNTGPGRGYFNWPFTSGEYEADPNDKSALSDSMKQDWRRDLRKAYAHEGWSQWEWPTGSAARED